MADAPIDAVIEVRANTAKLDGDLAAAKAKAESGGAGVDAAAKATAATNAQTAATSRLGDELRKVKKTYGEQIEVVQGLIGKIAAIGATVAIAYKVGAAIREYVVSALEDGAERAKDFQASLTSLDTAIRFDATKKQITEVEGQLATALEDLDKMSGLGLGPQLLYQRKVDQLKEQLDKLRKDAKIQEDFLKGQGIDAETLKRKKQQEELSKLTGDAMKSRMTEEQRITADSEAKKDAIRKAFTGMNKDDQIKANKAVTDAIAAIEADRQAKIQALVDADNAAAEEGRKRIADEQQKRREAFEDYMAGIAEAARAQEEAARRVQQTWAQTFRQIREENNRAFATDQAASMVQLAAQLRTEGTIASANMARIVVEGVG